MGKPEARPDCARDDSSTSTNMSASNRTVSGALQFTDTPNRAASENNNSNRLSNLQRTFSDRDISLHITPSAVLTSNIPHPRGIPVNSPRPRLEMGNRGSLTAMVGQQVISRTLQKQSETHAYVSDLCMLGCRSVQAMLLQMAKAYRFTCQYMCEEALTALRELPTEQYHTGWVLHQVGKSMTQQCNNNTMAVQ